jgi:hypothetical protein
MAFLTGPYRQCSPQQGEIMLQTSSLILLITRVSSPLALILLELRNYF